MSLIITRGLGSSGSNGATLIMPLTIEIEQNNLELSIATTNLTIEINDETVNIDIGE